LVAAFSLARRMSSPAPRLRLLDNESVAYVVRPWLADARRERVAVVVCDSALRVRRAFVITEGASDRCLVPVREILTAVLLHDGAAFAIAHNHPSGDVRPSAADRTMTASLERAAEAVGLDFLAHLVVAGDAWARCSSEDLAHDLARTP
jgi:DNA repair protein RadC